MKTAVASLLNSTVTVSLVSSASGAILVPVPQSIGNAAGNTTYPFVTVTVAQAAYITAGNVSTIAAASTVSPPTGPIATLGSVTGGSVYTNGTYTGVNLSYVTSGNGSGAVATVVVSGAAVTSVTITSPGTGYTVADSLTATAAQIGGTGSGFHVPVATLVAASISYGQASVFLPNAGSYTFYIGQATYVSVINGTTTAAPVSLLFGSLYDKH